MKNNVQIYSVMLEGIDASLGYFINVGVAASDPTHATKLALERARDLGLHITAVEEITKTRRKADSEAQVLSISGKSYFPLEQ
jgi:hypothetical protein